MYDWFDKSGFQPTAKFYFVLVGFGTLAVLFPFGFMYASSHIDFMADFSAHGPLTDGDSATYWVGQNCYFDFMNYVWRWVRRVAVGVLPIWLVGALGPSAHPTRPRAIRGLVLVVLVAVLWCLPAAPLRTYGPRVCVLSQASVFLSGDAYEKERDSDGCRIKKDEEVTIPWEDVRGIEFVASVSAKQYTNTTDSWPDWRFWVVVRRTSGEVHRISTKPFVGYFIPSCSEEQIRTNQNDNRAAWISAVKKYAPKATIDFASNKHSVYKNDVVTSSSEDKRLYPER